MFFDQKRKRNAKKEEGNAVNCREIETIMVFALKQDLMVEHLNMIGAVYTMRWLPKNLGLIIKKKKLANSHHRFTGSTLYSL